MCEWTSSKQFSEKPDGDGWINGGYFVLEPEVVDLIDSDECIWEQDALNAGRPGRTNSVFSQRFLAANGYIERPIKTSGPLGK